MTEFRNGDFKIEIRSQEFNNSGIHNVDICIMPSSSLSFPTESSQCFLHGFDFSNLSVRWISARNVEVSFGCGRISRFTNFAIVTKEQSLPVEFHATLNDACNAASGVGRNAAQKS